MTEAEVERLLRQASWQPHFLKSLPHAPRGVSLLRALRNLPQRLRAPLWKRAECSQFLRHYGLMLEAGLSHPRCLALLVSQAPQKAAQVLEKARKKVEGGSPPASVWLNRDN